MRELPAALVHAVEQALARVPPARIERAAHELSARYRGDRTTTTPLASGATDALAYATLLLPACYAQISAALRATAARAPGWVPYSQLDLGSGPGTALWAATAQWPALQRLTALEREPAFLALARELAAASPVIQQTHWLRGDVTAPPDAPADLVTIAHVLNELPAAQQARAVAAAWQRTAGVLLIVEPGTPAGFAVVRAARDQLLALGARTLAPCPHDLPCPLADDWCHFPERIVRPAFTRRARGASSPYEDAKYAYAAMARFAAEVPIAARVLREPFANKAYAEAQLCTADGISTARASRRERAAYDAIAELVWGETC